MSVLAKRHRYLEAISRRPLEKPSIIETLDAPRSTVNRAIRELEQTDLVKRTDEGYQLTLVGRTVLNEYREYDANIEMICGAAEVMAEIPDAVPFDVQILQNADVIVAEPPAVDEPLNYLLGLFERADRIEMVTSVVLRSYFDVWHRRLLDDSLELDVVLPLQAVEVMMTEYGHEFEEALGTGRMAVSERTMAPPFGLVVADGTSGGRMSLVAYSDTGVYGLISTTEAVAVQWARDLFAEHRGASTKLTPGVRPPAHNN